MIDYLRGEVTELTPTYVVLDVRGVGYMVHVGLYTYTALQQLGKTAEVKVYIYEAIREDAHLLYGFLTTDERLLFELLISVSGVGANTARTILSAFPPDELRSVIVSEQDNRLKQVKGIGLKTAQRIIVELKDRIAKQGFVASSAATVNVNKVVADEAVQALGMLGFPAAVSQKVVAAVLSDAPDAPVEQVIKSALKHL